MFPLKIDWYYMKKKCNNKNKIEQDYIEIFLNTIKIDGVNKTNLNSD